MIAFEIIAFGLAQIAPSLQQEALTRQKKSGLTQFGQAVMGTLHYAPPEQQGYFEYGVPTVKSDIFSFGATMYRFWTGLSPRRFSDRNLPNVPELRELVFDCVEEDPNNRPNSAELLVEQLEQIFKTIPILTPIPISTPSFHPEMVSIPAGRFKMGSNELSMASFAIGKYQVIFAEYDKFVAATGAYKPSDEEWGRENRPVINVSSIDATAYANWLSEQTGENYRLPTEAEWEYAARAGATTCYCFGEDYKILDEYAWYWENWNGKTHTVGAKKPNAYGFMMYMATSGNGQAQNITKSLKTMKIIIKIIQNG